MRRTDFLITSIRQISRNTDSSPTSGIPDEEILQYINDAQDRLQALISNQKTPSKIFTTEKIISVVDNQDGYSLNDRLFYNKEIQQIEWSVSGNLSDYQLLRKLSFFNRDTIASSYPIGYYTRGNMFFPVPILTGTVSSFRVMYERALDDVDKRRGLISTVTGLGADTFTSITLDSTADETSNPNLATIDYVCINDVDGNVTMYNIPVGNYNTGTNVLTPRAGFTFQAGETVAVNSYVTFGKYSTTHCKLPDECENYLIQYSVYEMFKRDSRQNLTQQSMVVADIETHIVKKLGSQTAEIQFIPTLDIDRYW